MVAVNEHVGNIERSTRTVKDCTRCHIHRNLYERYLRSMVTRCVIKSVKDLNGLPSLNSISQKLSPITLLTGDSSQDFNKVNVLNFGDCAQVHSHNTRTNMPRMRTVGGIALHPPDNDQRI